MSESYSVISFAAGNFYSYFIVDGGEAVIVDPHITLVEEYQRRLKKKNLSLVGIVDTHTHADHISSAAVLKKKFDVPLYMSENAVSSLDVTKLKEGDKIKVAGSEITALYTPGHTDDSVTLLTEKGDLFSGDTLLINSIGRTDFQNGSPEDMFDSLERLGELPDETIVRPAHDYKGNKTSTIESEKKSNPFMAQSDKSAFAENARSKKISKPANMDTIIAANRQGTAETFSTVSPKQAHQNLSSEDAVLLDVRTDQEVGEVSVKVRNFKHVPLQSLSSAISSLPSDDRYYVLCRSGHRAAMAAMNLMQNGFGKVAVIKGGLTAWQKAKLPVKKSKGPISLERQVRIAAGCIVLAGALLSLVNVWFVIIPVFVGCGLAYAGITDTCMMANMLMKLPYNQKPLSSAGGGCALDGGGCSLDGGDSSDSGAGCSM